MNTLELRTEIHGGFANAENVAQVSRGTQRSLYTFKYTLLCSISMPKILQMKMTLFCLHLPFFHSLSIRISTRRAKKHWPNPHQSEPYCEYSGSKNCPNVCAFWKDWYCVKE